MVKNKVDYANNLGFGESIQDGITYIFKNINSQSDFEKKQNEIKKIFKLFLNSEFVEMLFNYKGFYKVELASILYGLFKYYNLPFHNFEQVLKENQKILLEFFAKNPKQLIKNVYSDFLPNEFFVKNEEELKEIVNNYIKKEKEKIDNIIEIEHGKSNKTKCKIYDLQNQVEFFNMTLKFRKKRVRQEDLEQSN